MNKAPLFFKVTRNLKSARKNKDGTADDNPDTICWFMCYLIILMPQNYRSCTDLRES